MALGYESSEMNRHRVDIARNQNAAMAGGNPKHLRIGCPIRNHAGRGLEIYRRFDTEQSPHDVRVDVGVCLKLRLQGSFEAS